MTDDLLPDFAVVAAVGDDLDIPAIFFRMRFLSDEHAPIIHINITVGTTNAKNTSSPMKTGKNKGLRNRQPTKLDVNV